MACRAVDCSCNRAHICVVHMNQEDENKDRRKFFILPFAIKFSHLISSDCSSLFRLGWRKEKKLDGGVLHVQLCLSSSAKKPFDKSFFFFLRRL